jgi:hypothetical protein
VIVESSWDTEYQAPEIEKKRKRKKNVKSKLNKMWKMNSPLEKGKFYPFLSQETRHLIEKTKENESESMELK